MAPPDPHSPQIRLSQSFKVSKIPSFKVFWYMLIQYYQKIISCFLEDIDPIFKMFKNCLNGSPGSFGTCLFGTFIFDFWNSETSKDNKWNRIGSHVKTKFDTEISLWRSRDHLGIVGSGVETHISRFEKWGLKRKQRSSALNFEFCGHICQLWSSVF